MNTKVENISKSVDEKSVIIDDIGAKIEKLDEKISSLEIQEIETLKKIEVMVESKFEASQSTIITLRKCLAEKDDYISDLEKRVKNLEVDVKSIHDININSDKEKLRKIGTLFECSKCPFSTKSEQGLKVHIGKKHTEQTFLRKCILCEKTFTYYTTFKSHKYEQSNWKKKVTLIHVKIVILLPIMKLHI